MQAAAAPHIACYNMPCHAHILWRVYIICTAAAAAAATTLLPTLLPLLPWRRAAPPRAAPQGAAIQARHSGYTQHKARHAFVGTYCRHTQLMPLAHNTTHYNTHNVTAEGCRRHPTIATHHCHTCHMLPHTYCYAPLLAGIHTAVPHATHTHAIVVTHTHIPHTCATHAASCHTHAMLKKYTHATHAM